MFSYIKDSTSFWPFHWNVQLKGKIPWFSFAILFALQSSPGLAQIPQICSLSKSVRFKPEFPKTFPKHGQTRFLTEMNFIWLKFPPFPQILAKVGEIVVWQWKPDFKEESYQKHRTHIQFQFPLTLDADFEFFHHILEMQATKLAFDEVVCRPKFINKEPALFYGMKRLLRLSKSTSGDSTPSHTLEVAMHIHLHLP